MARLDRDDMPEPYRLSNERPTRPRYVRMKGFRASSDRESDEFDKPALKRFLGSDPFPWALALCVLVWIGLGLATRAEPLFGVALILAGLAVCFLSQLWLYISIFMDDREAGILSLISGWYRLFYLYSNPELAWRPSVLAGVGVLMMITGCGMAWTRAMNS
jgi:hypothetical protein